jgi:hypothetical protein
MRQVYFLSAMLFTIVLCVSGIGLAAAEPQKTRLKWMPCASPIGKCTPS